MNHTFFKSSWLFKIHVEVQQILYIIFETNVTGISQFDNAGSKVSFSNLYIGIKMMDVSVLIFSNVSVQIMKHVIVIGYVIVVQLSILGV